ncbi:DUF748 domain-containing protein [Patiriisocius hiemis]|uniref:DUF748 domain-containing protein n=1 Tax=Patiriisocius hiemis TaxID=3075604 RepID=A0ABU2Y8T1_9FLAO|nr:DUF748 domain-containing protein [Constantimarinum sp. W242]MDT0554587.1 DUF748 domain-containing protein [Constantimarinum sp. W242]
MYLYFMANKKKKLLYIVTTVMLLFVALSLFINSFVKNKVEEHLSNLPQNVDLSYKNLTISTISGSIILNDIKLVLKNDTLPTKDNTLFINSIEVTNTSYWDYIVNNKISIQEIVVIKPNVTYNKKESSQKENSFLKELSEKPININRLSIEDGSLNIIHNKKDSLLLQATNVNVLVEDLLFSEEIKNKPIPFQFKNYTISSEELKYQLNDFDILTSKSISVTPKNSEINNLAIKTRYSKEKLSTILKTERDHFDFTVDSLTLSNSNFETTANDSLKFTIEKVELENPKLNIYRDKLVPDDTTIKPMYATLLQELPFKITISKVELNNGHIDYSEKVKKDRPTGNIYFSKLNAQIDNITNEFIEDTTKIDIKATFMNQSPISVQWNFNANDQFNFKADIGSLQAQKLNQFTEASLNTKVSGMLDKTYFSINGNSSIGNIDLKIKYEDFEVKVLTKDGKEKNKFISAIVNLFISKKSDETNSQFKNGKKEEVKRDKTKSIFNFIWKNVSAALLDALT